MILWVVLFLLIVSISFVLALLSMRDYQEIPKKSSVEYSLFLIRQTELFNHEFLNTLKEAVVKEGLIVSIERLFKGKQTALTIFGPKIILAQFIDKLGLLELEDYTLSLSPDQTSVWEVAAKSNSKPDTLDSGNLFHNLPVLGMEDQFLWQVILSPDKDKAFHTQIRAAVYAKEFDKRKDLTEVLQNFSVSEFIKIPRPFSQSQMVDFYKERSFRKEGAIVKLGFDEILRLLKVA